jgi:hypothetical protein
VWNFLLENHFAFFSFLFSCVTVSIPGEFDKPEYQNENAFIDVLCVPQHDVETAAVVHTTMLTYSNCWLVIFVDGGCLRRAWCALEIAVGTSSGCRLTVLGSCDIITGKRFYEELEATFESDVGLIKGEILSIFKTEQAFNEVVASAMQVLFVVAQKNKEYPVFATPRAERAEWLARMPSTDPKTLPRDKEQDWAVVTGRMSAVKLDATTRALRVFLSSTFSDTVLEWRFFLQDVVPYLKVCARLRGLDFDVSDMRFGNKLEESLPLDIRLTELGRCGDESADVLCLLFLGNMYGPRPPPARIPKQELEGLLQKMTREEKDFVMDMYVLDENQLDSAGEPTPEYILIQPEELVPSQHKNTVPIPENFEGQQNQAEDMALQDSVPTQQQSKHTALEQVLRTAALKLWPASTASSSYDLKRFSFCF